MPKPDQRRRREQMAKGRPGRRATQGGGGTGKGVAGFVIGAAVALGGVYLYQHTAGGPASRSETDARPLPETTPEAVSPAPQPVRKSESQARGDEASQAAARGAAPAGSGQPEATKVPVAPFGISEEVFEAGARVYKQQACGGCHGQPGRDGSSPSAGQFWNRSNQAGAWVTGQSVGTIYQAIAVGAPASGMPSYRHHLSDTDLWDLALLLGNARGDLPDPVLRILRTR